jgi:hypothetical protein
MSTIRRELLKPLPMTPEERREAEQGRCVGAWHFWAPWRDHGTACQCGARALFEFGGLTLVQDTRYIQEAK